MAPTKTSGMESGARLLAGSAGCDDCYSMRFAYELLGKFESYLGLTKLAGPASPARRCATRNSP